jgi:DNA-binding NtrC family response regulator
MPKILEGRRIMIVEDEYLIAMEVQDLLTDLGAEVVGPFGHLAPAFDAVNREQLHGALLDVRLDGETIDEIAEALVARGVPVLLTTGYEKAQLPPSLQHLPRVRKPYDERELRGLLERALSQGAGPESPT